MIRVALTAALACVCGAAFADEPDGLTLPPGFHAQVVADNLGAIRHMAIRGNGDIYVSTRKVRDLPGGIIALKLSADHTAGQAEHFGSVDGGTGIRIAGDALYASSSTGVWRFTLGDGLIPADAPVQIVDGLAASNHPLALDGHGSLYVGIDGGGGAVNCPDPANPKGAKPKGLMPCPLLETKGGIWRFAAARPGQTQADGEHFATGYRNMAALDWRQGDALYGAWHGRDATAKTWPEYLTPADDDAIADEMHRITHGTDMGWPYSYWDGARKVRLLAPDYGGDGKTPADGHYATPVASFQPKRPAVLDLVFYDGRQFPRSYRGGAFLAMHGGGSDGSILAEGHGGYDVVFVPFDRAGKAGQPIEFAGGFAGPGPGDKNEKTARYRPVGVATGPDGALYVADSNKGRIWRISYGETAH